MAAALGIGALVEAVAAIATIVTQTGKIVDEIQPRKKIPAEQIDELKLQINQLEESTKQIGHVAEMLGAYVQSYVNVNPIATKCERLLVYLRENRSRLAEESGDDAWSVAYFMFRDIDHEAKNMYKLTTETQARLLAAEDLGFVKALVGNFEGAAGQAQGCIEHKWPEDLLRHVELMDRASREIPNVLQRRINQVLDRLAELR